MGATLQQKYIGSSLVLFMDFFPIPVRRPTSAFTDLHMKLSLNTWQFASLGVTL